MVNEWLSCPFCGTFVMLRRLGKVGVAQSQVGKRRDVEESDRFHCDGCGGDFRDSGVIWREYYGYTPDEEVSL